VLTRQRQTSLDDHTMAVATYWAAKRHGVSEQTIYTWRKRFGGFQASEVRRLKQLEAENARLKKLVAERDLEIEVIKEVVQKTGERAGSSAASGWMRAMFVIGVGLGPWRHFGNETLMQLNSSNSADFRQAEELSRNNRVSSKPGAGQNDLLIAAHALTLGHTVVTDNEREFSRIVDLRIENWLR
jgi:Transposase